MYSWRKHERMFCGLTMMTGRHSTALFSSWGRRAVEQLATEASKVEAAVGRSNDIQSCPAQIKGGPAFPGNWLSRTLLVSFTGQNWPGTPNTSHHCSPQHQRLPSPIPPRFPGIITMALSTKYLPRLPIPFPLLSPCDVGVCTMVPAVCLYNS